MVVDDDMANLQMAGTILSKNNMRVTALKSGQALLNYITEHGAPDLILLDIMMPEMDGFETLKNLRKLEKSKGLSETPVIFLTADEKQEPRARALRSAFPISSESLLIPKCCFAESTMSFRCRRRWTA